MSFDSKSFAKIWWIALLVKTVFAICLPLSNDEAYYWVWGHNPQLSYFDHPAFVGWLFWFGTFFESIGNAARLPGVVLGHCTLLIWHQILKPSLNEKNERFWLLFVLLSPFFGVGSLIITPDVPMMFFWSLSLLLLRKLIEKPKASLYLAFGAALGVGFCAKYMIVLFVPTALLWLGWSGQWRKIRMSYVPLTIIAGLLCCFPVLYWNSQNEWASFLFQLKHGLGGEKRHATWPLEYLGGQIGILFPTTIYFALKKRKVGQPDLSFLRFFGWVPIAFFFYTSFKARVEANWPTMAHLPLLSLAVLNSETGGIISKWLKATAAIWATALVLITSQVVYPWFPVSPKSLKTSEFSRFDALIPIAEEYGDQIYFGSYQMASAISYKLRRQFYKLAGVNRRDFYDFIPQSHPNGDKFYVCIETSHPLPEWLKNDSRYNYEPKVLRQVGEEYSIYEVTRIAKDTHQ